MSYTNTDHSRVNARGSSKEDKSSKSPKRERDMEKMPHGEFKNKKK